MKKIYSLRSSKEFDKVINSGKKKRTRYLFISYIDADEFKLGISIPKKLGNAVFRNKNKRRIKNIVQQLKPYELKKHIVIIVKKEFTELTFNEMKKIIKKELV